MVTGLIAALLAGAASAYAGPTPTLPQARPAMWRVRDHDTTIYLFGTFHALDGRTRWFEDSVKDAFSSSDELVLETIIPRAPNSSARFRGDSIYGHRYNLRANSLSVAPNASFMASTRMAMSVGRDRGLQVSKGADMVLRDAAENEGKAVQGLESLEFQLGMFDTMSARARASRPVHAAQARTQLAGLMMQMQAAWNAGDQRIFTSLLNDMHRSNPVTYRVMFPERNAHWAGWIVDRMERPGTVFVAVGAGHFAGPDSVQSQLTLKGVVATRIN